MVFSSCDSKAVGFDGADGLEFLDQTIKHFPHLKSLLDDKTRYDISVGTGARWPGGWFGKGDESSIFHHYIVLYSPKLSTRKNCLIFELQSLQIRKEERWSYPTFVNQKIAAVILCTNLGIVYYVSLPR